MISSLTCIITMSSSGTAAEREKESVCVCVCVCVSPLKQLSAPARYATQTHTLTEVNVVVDPGDSCVSP